MMNRILIGIWLSFWFLKPCLNTGATFTSVIKQKGESQNGCFEKTKHAQIFRKTNIYYPLIRTSTQAYQGVKNVRFSENLMCLVFLKHSFCDSHFCLITDDFKVAWKKWRKFFWYIENQNKVVKVFVKNQCFLNNLTCFWYFWRCGTRQYKPENQITVTDYLISGNFTW